MPAGEPQADLHLASHNVEYVEGLLEKYLTDNASVPPSWQRYFHELTSGNGDHPPSGRAPACLGALEWPRS